MKARRVLVMLELQTTVGLPKLRDRMWWRQHISKEAPPVYPVVLQAQANVVRAPKRKVKR